MFSSISEDSTQNPKPKIRNIFVAFAEKNYLCNQEAKFVEIMCQTAFISQSIIKLGARSYKHNLEAMVPSEYRVSQLRRLNRDLDTFYEFLYSQCNTVTEHDYNVFGKQLTSMLDVLKKLYVSCKQMPKEFRVSAEAEKLKRNYYALYELNNDIKNYRIKASKDAEWTSLLADASIAMKKISAHD